MQLNLYSIEEEEEEIATEVCLDSLSLCKNWFLKKLDRVVLRLISKTCKSIFIE
jgi:hypothetical protein